MACYFPAWDRERSRSSAAVCFVPLCYGGGFGTMPAYDGAILTAWSTTGVVGPQAIASLNDRYSQNAFQYAFLLMVCVRAVGLVASLGLRDRA